jgi:hypothetical protein
MPLLHGYLNPAPGTPCFLVPLFVEFPGSNRVLVQEISQNDMIEAFLEMDIEVSCESPLEHIQVMIGQPAHWAFQLATGNIIYGNASAVASALGRILKKKVFAKFPLIQSQVAKFCADSRRYHQALESSFKMLTRYSPISAGIWRDAIVIAPMARRELNTSVQGTLSQTEIDEIRVFGDAGQLKVEIPHRIIDQVNRIRPHMLLPETTKLAKVFGLSEPTLTPKYIATTKERKSSNEPRAIVRGFSGTGEMIARALHRIRGYEYVIPPWVPLSKVRRFRQPQKPFYVFAITNLNTVNIEAAIKFVGAFRGTEIKVAIALLPLSFGTLRSEEAVTAQLEILSAAFDYIFVIGNHLLQKPPGAAPGLTASSKAIKYVRACVNALMEIAWADYGPRTAREFQKIFPYGFGLIGRAHGTRNELDHSSLFREAVGTMLNERLSLEDAKRIVLAGSSSIIKSREAFAFVGEAVANTRNEVLTVESMDTRQAITILAFGIGRHEITSASFRSLCLSLLIFLGWSVLDKDGKRPIVRASSPEAGETHFAFLNRGGSLDEIIQEFSKIPKARHVILTNFKPPPNMRSACVSQKIWAFHYSLLEEYTGVFSSRGKDWVWYF